MAGRTNPNPQAVLELLLKNIKASVNKQTAAKCIDAHPDYDSFLAMCDCLDEWNIGNKAIQIEKKLLLNSDNIAYPFIAYFEEQRRFILVKKYQNGEVFYSDEATTLGRMGINEFMSLWDGVMLECELNKDSKEKDYKLNKLRYILQDLMKPLAFVLASILLISVAISHMTTPAYLPLFLIKITGLIVSILLLAQGINANNPFFKDLCGLIGKNDCNTILQSQAAKITEWLSWSEVGFFYFAGGLTALILAPSCISYLFLLNLFALPYTIYSISFQYRKKAWCLLCCTVQVLLLLEALTGILYSINYLEVNLSMVNWLYFLLSLITPVLIWATLKPLIAKAAQLQPTERQLNRFKYNENLFQQTLQKQPRYGVGLELMPIIMGDPEAKTIITMVSNPYCNPCSIAHKTLVEWLKQRNDLQLRIIFASSDQATEARTQVARHITALSMIEKPETVHAALDNWYLPSTKFEDWVAKFPAEHNDAVANATKRQKEWCEMAEIEHTPTILINGYKLPELYQIKDLKFLIN